MKPSFPGICMLFLVTVLVSGVLLITACATPQQVGSSPTAIDDALSVLSARALWPQAVAIAQDWRHDAFVRLVDVDVRVAGSPGTVSTVSWDFQSPTDQMVTLIVWCNAQQCDSFEVEQTPGFPLPPCTPIELEDYALDSTEAFEIALQQGGEPYLKEHPVSRILLQLTRQFRFCEGDPHWRVLIADPFLPEGLDFLINATTGDVVER